METSLPNGRAWQHRVLILINVRWLNATAFYAVNIGRILHNHGHRVIVGCDPGYPAYKLAHSLGLPVAPLGFGGLNPIRLVRNWHRLLKLIRTERIEIVNPHRSEDHSFALLAKLFTGIRVVITRGDQRRIRSGWLSGLRYRLADALIVTCRAIADQNPDIFLPMARRVHVIYGSVDEDRFAKTAAMPSPWLPAPYPDGPLVLGMVGRISKTKDQFTFIRAAALIAQCHPKVVFLIAGDGVDDPKRGIVRQLAANGLSARFRLIPRVPEIGPVIERIDIGVIASVRSETISRVLLEFFYFKKPVIGTRVNVIAEMIQTGVNGELFSPGDERTLAALMDKLIRSADLRARYGQNAYRDYQTQYTQTVFRQKYESVLSQVLKRCQGQDN